MEVKNNDGRTPLMEEAENGKTGIVNALLDRGANIEDKDKNGDTALMLAASSGTNRDGEAASRPKCQHRSQEQLR